MLPSLFKRFLKRTPLVPRPSCIHDHELKARELRFRWESWEDSSPRSPHQWKLMPEGKKQPGTCREKRFAHKCETRELGRMKPECTGWGSACFENRLVQLPVTSNSNFHQFYVHLKKKKKKKTLLTSHLGLGRKWQIRKYHESLQIQKT